MQDESPKREVSKREVKKRARGQLPALVRSTAIRTLLFAAVLLAVGLICKPWKWEWLRPDEAVSIAEDYLFNQGVGLEHYTLIQAAEYRSHGTWNGINNEAGFVFNPAVGYVLRFFREDRDDSWTLHVSPAGQIYRVSRELPSEEPGYRLTRDEALKLVLKRMGNDLTIATLNLTLISDSLTRHPQRADWDYVFTSPDFPVGAEHLKVRLSGQIITQLRFESVSELPALPARGGAGRSRMAGFALIIFGVFQIILHHRHPLAWQKGAMWGGIAFVLIILIRGLTIPQSVILLPGGGDAEGFLLRVALGGVVEALQGAILVGLIVATGEAISRDLLPNVTTFTRIAPSHRGWVGAWIQAARWALPAAALVLALESAIAVYVEPGGLSGKALPIVAGTLSSPVHFLTSAALVGKDVLWDEGLYRLWLFPLLIFWVRGPLTALLLSSALATYFAGFNPDELLTTGAAQYLLWGVISGWLMLRVGIFAAMLFHLLVLGGYAGLALLWTGFSLLAGIVLIFSLLMILIAIVLKGEELILTGGDDT